MKLLVLAHKPPPHHGQSYMVQLLLDSLGGDAHARRHGEKTETLPGSAGVLECHHVDARYSDSQAEIGQPSWRKLARALKFCALAVACRFRHGVTTLYFVPSNAALTSLRRDWLVLALCRPFFRKVIFHWHSMGLGEWMQRDARWWERWLCRRFLGRPDLSIVLRPYNRRDAEAIDSRHVVVVPNGLPDPCPEFDRDLRPRRIARAAMRRKLLAGTTPETDEIAAAGEEPQVLRVLFLSLCFREKGLFDAVEAVALLHRQLHETPLRVRFVVAGTFWFEAEKAEFEQRILQADLQDDGRPAVEYRGFVGGADKQRLFSESDCLVFPTYYQAESFGLVLVESLAYGLPVITTHWRDVHELLPESMRDPVEPRSPAQIAARLRAVLEREFDPDGRQHFLDHYTVAKFAERMREVLRSV